MLPEADRVRLQHMLDAARSALRFMQDRRREDLDPERLRYEMIFTPGETVSYDGMTNARAFVRGENHD